MISAAVIRFCHFFLLLCCFRNSRNPRFSSFLLFLQSRVDLTDKLPVPVISLSVAQRFGQWTRIWRECAWNECCLLQIVAGVWCSVMLQAAPNMQLWWWLTLSICNRFQGGSGAFSAGPHAGGGSFIFTNAFLRGISCKKRRRFGSQTCRGLVDALSKRVGMLMH